MLKNIQFIHEKLNPNYDLYFANGGDQVNESILKEAYLEVRNRPY